MGSNIRFLNPKTMAKPPGYTHVVEATGPNRLIYIAGQLGLDMDNKLVGAPGDFRAQVTKAFENLQAALVAVGASFKDVVKINNYLTDMSNGLIFREVRDALRGERGMGNGERNKAGERGTANAERFVPRSPLPEIELIGPAPLPFYKLRGHFRWHVMLKIPKDLLLSPKIYSLLMDLKKPSGVAFQLDVDPLNIL